MMMVTILPQTPIKCLSKRRVWHSPTVEFIQTRKNVLYVCNQIWSHDLSFLLDEVFPEITVTHIYKCMQIIWQMTYRLADNAPTIPILPAAILNLLPFKNHQTRANKDITVVHSSTYLQQKLLATFVNWPPRHQSEKDAFKENQPTTMTNRELFLECCKKLLAMRSFYNYYGEHCHHAIPRKVNDSLNVDTIQEQTREVGDIVKAALNWGEGTTQQEESLGNTLGRGPSPTDSPTFFRGTRIY
jgi:hypothetical protein